MTKLTNLSSKNAQANRDIYGQAVQTNTQPQIILLAGGPGSWRQMTRVSPSQHNCESYEGCLAWVERNESRAANGATAFSIEFW
jgi:hypothetical protein